MATSESGNSLDLLIINPGAAHGIYGELGSKLVAVEPPLWARLIAGYVRDRNYDVKIIDAEAFPESGPREVAALAVAAAPRLVCIAVYGHQPSASTQQMHAAGLTARAIKEIAPNLPIIMVGGHVSALPLRTMMEEQIDFACVGEGPITVAGLLNERRRLQDVSGLVWRNGPEITINRSAPLIDNLMEMQGDVWDLLPMERYRAHNWQVFGDISKRQPYASIYTSLGCPFKCSFCCINAPFQSHRYRMRDPALVVDEIVKLNLRYGITTFKIVDEMFVLKERHYTAICEGIIDRIPDAANYLNIWAYARVDTVKPNTLALLRSAGIKWLALGIESASAHVRDGSDKSLRNSDIKGIVRAIQSADINVIGNYIFGLPDDDVDSMQETLALALDLCTEFANFYSAMAYPGSRLFDDAVKSGQRLPETWRGYSQHNDDCLPLGTQYLDAATVLRFRDDAFLRYFCDPGYQAMVLRKFGRKTFEHVKEMTKYRLTRKILVTA